VKSPRPELFRWLYFLAICAGVVECLIKKPVSGVCCALVAWVAWRIRND
jgi:hypothetical protein